MYKSVLLPAKCKVKPLKFISDDKTVTKRNSHAAKCLLIVETFVSDNIEYAITIVIDEAKNTNSSSHLVYKYSDLKDFDDTFEDISIPTYRPSCDTIITFTGDDLPVVSIGSNSPYYNKTKPCMTVDKIIIRYHRMCSNNTFNHHSRYNSGLNTGRPNVYTNHTGICYEVFVDAYSEDVYVASNYLRELEIEYLLLKEHTILFEKSPALFIVNDNNQFLIRSDFSVGELFSDKLPAILYSGHSTKNNVSDYIVNNLEKDIEIDMGNPIDHYSGYTVVDENGTAVDVSSELESSVIYKLIGRRLSRNNKEHIVNNTSDDQYISICSILIDENGYDDSENKQHLKIISEQCNVQFWELNVGYYGNVFSNASTRYWSYYITGNNSAFDVLVNLSYDGTLFLSKPLKRSEFLEKHNICK